MNEQILAILRTLLADNIALKFKAQGYHWNVEGDDFKQLHDFFGEIYEDFESATDTFAEWMRSLKAYAPYRLVDFFDASSVSGAQIVGDGEAMIEDLYEDIENHIEMLKDAGDVANSIREYGLSNFFAERQTACQKFCWQLRASMEMEEED